VGLPQWSRPLHPLLKLQVNRLFDPVMGIWMPILYFSLPEMSIIWYIMQLRQVNRAMDRRIPASWFVGCGGFRFQVLHLKDGTLVAAMASGDSAHGLHPRQTVCSPRGFLNHSHCMGLYSWRQKPVLDIPQHIRTQFTNDALGWSADYDGMVRKFSGKNIS